MHYRFLFVDDTGHVFGGTEYDGREDYVALQAAEALCATHGLEIWQGDRLVALLKKGGESEVDCPSLLIPSLPRPRPRLHH